MEIVATAGLLGIERPLKRGDRLLFARNLTHYHDTRVIPDSDEGTVASVGNGFVICERAGNPYTLTPDNIRSDRPKVALRVPFVDLNVNFRLHY